MVERSSLREDDWIMAPRIGWRHRLLAVLAGMVLLSSIAQASDPRAAERFRAAAALQQRALYELAAAEYAVVIGGCSDAPLSERAKLQRGICLFQLKQYDEALAELRKVVARFPHLSAEETEQLFAYRGLAEYNLALAQQGDRRNRPLDAAIESLTEQLGEFPVGPLASWSIFYRAEALYARGRLDKAVAAYQSLLQKYPQHSLRADALYALGVAEQDRANYVQALLAFELFRREFPEHAAAVNAQRRQGDVLLGLAESQLVVGQLEAALRTVDLLLRNDRESSRVPPALLVRARVQFRHSDFKAAEVTLNECIHLSTQDVVMNEARLLRSKIRCQRGDFAESLVDVGKVLARDPQRTEALHVRGRCELGLGEPTAAAQTLGQILQCDPQYFAIDGALYDLAWAYRAANEPEHATATFAKLSDSFPESPLAAECHFRVGEAKYATKDFTAAVKSYFRACELAKDPTLLDNSHHKLAWSCFEQGQFGAAEEAFDRQIAIQHERMEAAGNPVDPAAPLDPLAADAMLMIAECRFQQQQYATAFQTFELAVGQPAVSASLRSMGCVHAAQCAAELKRWDDSLRMSDHALRDFPESQWAAAARAERGRALYELGRLEEAERELASVAAKCTGLIAVKTEFVLGQIFVARKQYDDAVRKFFKVAYGHGGVSAPATYHHWQAEAVYEAARALEQLQRPDEARKLYQELLESYPACERAAVARKSVERILQR